MNAGQCPSELLIDDMEDNDGQIAVNELRGGYWYTAVDDKGSTIEPPPGAFQMAEGGADDSSHAARFHGHTGNGGNWANLGFQLTADGSPYDLSCCTGVSFRAKRDPRGTGNVRFKVGDAQTVPEGGMCDDCYNDFGIDLGFTDDWRTITVEFARLRQQSGWGTQFERVMPNSVYHFQWQVHHPRFNYDVWIDDVRLVGCGDASATR